MKHKLTSAIALCAIAGLSGPAFADCQEELAKLTGEAGMETEGEISKDGSLAPLEDPDADAGATDTSAASSGDTGDDATDDGEVVKDGDNEPLDADTSQVATSGQDAAAQQEGDSADSSASADSADSSASGSQEMSQEAKDAIATAKAALEAGDETACMEAVEEARNS
ncbi:hypothetical protein ACSQ76_07325 [Roseovarius sp. B08]|uniref:hypothetical protein n=1 Tax=Roseovarius sp. B08 TaxID=3449223 RepID=UPI003EDBB1EA